MFGERSLDLPVHWQEEVCGARVSHQRDEQEDQGGGRKKETGTVVSIH